MQVAYRVHNLVLSEGIHEFDDDLPLWFIPSDKSTHECTFDGAGVFELPDGDEIWGIVYSIHITEDDVNEFVQKFAHDFKEGVYIYSRSTHYPVKMRSRDELFKWFDASEVLEDDQYTGKVTQFIA